MDSYYITISIIVYQTSPEHHFEIWDKGWEPIYN